VAIAWLSLTLLPEKDSKEYYKEKGECLKEKVKKDKRRK